ncbi:GDP-mannose 4,6-dehydratase [Paenibacillus arenilitoris]|uniref:GDP-mannose 4,6-dehydratase n=1 Tax=Paenibacillus arenilitoris TaxID=2772299 RepID=A0A927CI74_9BACL|nr:GDP-mannose 4,6-dehydratase [Paenibacillus arenilitoris]MBD2867960.1 GDP-mannose 4,6-dehydratase [Paenibacillus arenilitoris]
MKALITGISGFVAGHLANLLIDKNIEVWGTTRHSSPYLSKESKVSIVKIDLESEEKILSLLNEVEPDYIFHLSGVSNVKYSWENKQETIESNIITTINLFEAVRKSNKVQKMKIISVGSAEEYGKELLGNKLITEYDVINPSSPYGISKATVSLLAKQYYDAYKLNIIHVRPFNHIGPNQKDGFVVIDFAKQIIEIERGLRESTVYTGNLNAYRDFTDVRDIVKAYYLLVSTPMSEYGFNVNVCSGKGVSIKSILEKLANLSRVDIDIMIDPSKFRPLDIPYLVGDNSKLIQLTNWKPSYELEQTLKDILEFLREK